VGADALTPQVALGAEGDGVVAWARYDGRTFVIQAVGYDNSGPALGKVAIPASGSVGRRLVFTVAPKDVWTTIGAIRWTFGDGTAGSGRATGHVYTRPGRYTARVTVADAFSHVTTVRRTVTIAG
jgi:PKD repeat protein